MQKKRYIFVDNSQASYHIAVYKSSSKCQEMERIYGSQRYQVGVSNIWLWMKCSITHKLLVCCQVYYGLCYPSFNNSLFSKPTLHCDRFTKQPILKYDTQTLKAGLSTLFPPYCLSMTGWANLLNTSRRHWYANMGYHVLMYLRSRKIQFLMIWPPYTFLLY